MLRHCSFIKHDLLTTAYIHAPAYVMSVLLTTAYIRKRVCRHLREAVYAGSPRSIPPVTCERHCQRGSHIQCKHSGINLHRTWIPVTSQCPDDFPGLAVIKHVHDMAVPEGVGVTGIEKCTPSASARLTACFSQLRMVSSVTAHNGSRRRGRVVIIQLSICLT